MDIGRGVVTLPLDEYEKLIATIASHEVEMDDLWHSAQVVVFAAKPRSKLIMAVHNSHINDLAEQVKISAYRRVPEPYVHPSDR